MILDTQALAPTDDEVRPPVREAVFHDVQGTHALLAPRGGCPMVPAPTPLFLVPSHPTAAPDAPAPDAAAPAGHAALGALPTVLRRVTSHHAKIERRFDRRRAPRVRFSLLALLFATIAAVLARLTTAQHHTPLNYYLSVVWTLYAPVILLGLVGAAYLRTTWHHARRGRSRDRHPSRADVGTGTAPGDEAGPVRRRKLARSDFAGRTAHPLIVTVPTLLVPGNLPALQRVLLSLLVHLPKNFEHFRVDVITEGSVDHEPLRAWLQELGLPGTHIRVLNVPSDYETPNGARFKTRANHYALENRRALGENSPEIYVYHLDDDTHIGADTASSLAEFIEEDGDRFLLAQGVLAFPQDLTSSRLCRLADAIRPADDITRFAFFTGMLGTPLGGLHGEHLVVRADIEDEIGWDFPDTVIEDSYFAIQFATRYPRQSTMLNSYSYGASPATVGDLIRQRRRWVEGLLRLACNRRLPLLPKLPLVYSILLWALAPFQFVGVALLVAFATGVDNTSPVSPLFLPLWAVSLAGVYWLYIEGLKVNLSASDRPRSFLLQAALVLPGVYVVNLIETLGVVWGIVRFAGIGRQRASEVIAKPH